VPPDDGKFVKADPSPEKAFAVTVPVIFNALLFIPLLSKLPTSVPSEINPTVPDAFLYSPVSVSAEKVIEGRLLEPAGNVPPAFM